MAERKSKGEKLPSVKSVRLRALSLVSFSLSLSLFSRVEARAFLSSKVALSENLSRRFIRIAGERETRHAS